MKLFGTLAVVAAAVGAQAHFRFTLGYGDAAFAALNNSTVGGQMTNGATVKVPLRGQSFRVQLWAEKIALGNGGVHEEYHPMLNSLIAYDSLPVYNSIDSWETQAPFRHRKITAKTAVAGGSVISLASNISCYRQDIFDEYLPNGLGFFAKITSRFRGVFTGNYANPRLAGLSGQFSFQSADGASAQYARIRVGDRNRLFDVDLTSQMDAGQTYGFAQGEAGLQAAVYNGLGTPSSGSATWLGWSISRNEVGMRVNLQAVPEPGSLVALALGALMLARRRHKA